MDALVEGVLKEVKRQCAAGSAIVSADDIRDGLDEGLRADDKEIAAALERLKARRIIEINFARGNVYCLSLSEEKQESEPLEESAPYKAEEDKPEGEKNKKTAGYAAIIALCAFLGGLAGGAAAGAVMAVL
ncbi:MAG TPA: hypothetical protein IAB64_03525 [Candidatus Coproplasma excrementavium]|nr:hypothetical protein [Candidatus Coproplasma excrementavium]